MSSFTDKEVTQAIVGFIKSTHFHLNSLEKDNDGQMIIYTGYYLWPNGTIHDEPEWYSLEKIAHK